MTGFRGTGKTSVGEILSKSLHCPLVDLDDEIEKTAGKTIREIFSDSGESTFRDLESTCLREVSSGTPTVIALGGGAILRKENRQLIAQTGLCIWLTADAESLLHRIQSDRSSDRRRPALTSLPALAEVRQLLADREPLYRQSADHWVDTGGRTIQAVADEILALLEAENRQQKD